VHPDYRFQMWDWVGGRYSLWSSIGVSIAVAIGRENFLKFLAGGHEMDEHFRTTSWLQNLPVLAGLAGIWNINFLDLPTHAVLPYDDRLKRFPAYLQQLEMESNGKTVTQEGRPVDWQTAPIVWGEPGDNAQRRRLPRAVGAEQRDDLTGRDFEIEVADHRRAVVPGSQAVDLEHRRRRHADAPSTSLLGSLTGSACAASASPR